MTEALMRATSLSTELSEIAEKVENQERLSFEDGMTLFRSHDLIAIGGLANQVRERINGDLTYYNVNRHMNYTNVCISDCAFCGFYRRVRHPEAYEWSVDECVEIARKAYQEGARELHIVGGLHPRLQFDYYSSLLSELKRSFPDMHLKAFTMVELDHLTRVCRMTDEEVARLTGRKVSAVRNRRQRNGLPPTHFLRRPWTKAEEKLLGSDTDEEIGRRLDRDRATAGDHRRQLRIPPKVPDWTQEEIELLGTVPDRQLAQQLGRTLFSVQNRRLKLGIPPAPNPKYRPWTEQELSLLGTMPDADLAKQITRPYAAVRDKRNQLNIAYRHPRYAWWKPQELELLSKYSDEDVAKMTGRAITAVQQKRWKLAPP
jgi:hypothetical protein